MSILSFPFWEAYFLLSAASLVETIEFTILIRFSSNSENGPTVARGSLGLYQQFVDYQETSFPAIGFIWQMLQWVCRLRNYLQGKVRQPWIILQKVLKYFNLKNTMNMDEVSLNNFS